MKICVITSLYKPYSKGGAERVVENIVDGLIKEGHQVVVLTTRPFGRDNENLLLPPPCKGGENTHPPSFSHLNGGQARGNITIIRFYPWNLFWFGNIDKKSAWLRLPWHVLDVFNLESYFKIKRILKAEKPDVVMTHNLKGIGYMVPMAVRHAGINVHTLHDVQLVEPSGLIFAALVEKRLVASLRRVGQTIYSWFNKKLFSSPDIVVSPSEWLLAFYEKRGFFKNSRKIVMNNPVYIPPPLGEGVETAKHSRCSGKENPLMKSHHPLPPPRGGGATCSDENLGEVKPYRIDIKLLYIGQIEEHKGIIFLIKSLKKLSAEMKIHLDMIGTGTKLADIKRLSEGNDNIKIHGYVENKLLNKIFAQSDFLIVPSLCMENAPTVIYESFAHGVPVIASNIGGICELVQEEYNGYMFEAGNFSSLKQTLLKCLEENEEWDRLKENSLNSINGLGVDDYIKGLITEIGNLPRLFQK